ncbi:unnamed protein product [Toxocara canis]|uniref:Pepsin-I3 domain-containing protein n=1 Tax=Toxocara canis TaxID=6265 RepID=A0A183UBF0_TOXCA|nr:unnamed protein product [Toxocara canis]
MCGMKKGNNSCGVFKDNQVFLADLPWKTLSGNDIQAGIDYQRRRDDCLKVKHDPTPACTNPPPFCESHGLKLYNFAGCSVLGNKLFKDQQYLRDLTAQDKEALKAFDAKVADYQKQQENAPLPPKPPVGFGILPPNGPRPPMPPNLCA